MPKMTIEWDQEELEAMVRDLLTAQGLRLSTEVEAPLRWKFRPKLRVIIRAEADPDAPPPPEETPREARGVDPGIDEEPLDEEQVGRKQHTKAGKRTPLDASMFPAGADVAALIEAAAVNEEIDKKLPLGPNESFDRQPPKRGPGR